MPDDVGLQIGGRTFRSWSDLEIHMAIDGMATIGFGAPFEPDRQEFRSTFRPFSYPPIDVTVDGSHLFRGTMVGVDPKTDENASDVKVTGYALPGVLADAHVPASTFPLEFDGLTLGQIADAIAAPFGLSVEVRGSDGAAFERVAVKPDQSPLRFLADLAKQRGMVISSTADGSVLLWRSATSSAPVARLSEGMPPVEAVSASFSPQAYFSEITGLASAKAGRPGSSYTARNGRLPGVVRPMTFVADDTERGDLPAATDAKLGRMFGNMVSYSVDVPTWRDPLGRLWSPNTMVALEAPGAMVYRETGMLIREVTLRQGDDELSATLNLVLPGAFSGAIPSRLPWDD